MKAELVGLTQGPLRWNSALPVKSAGESTGGILAAQTMQLLYFSIHSAIYEAITMWQVHPGLPFDTFSQILTDEETEAQIGKKTLTKATKQLSGKIGIRTQAIQSNRPHFSPVYLAL